MSEKDMLERLHAEVRVLAQQPGALDDDISAVIERYPELPTTLAELMREATELELAYRGRYLRLYGPKGCVEMDEAYSISSRIPGAVVIGDNGGCEAILFLPDKGIYRVEYGALDPDEMHFIASTLDGLLVRAEAPAEAVGGCRV